ncbi:gliding motility-associated C-terminal domain-containing protein [Cytophaga hutchinsonii ATCC 33406]|nr:gliding motility-associated C-terminal domain-containing protein [Cytophaga hutchinsonii ATCC 33406]
MLPGSIYIYHTFISAMKFFVPLLFLLLGLQVSIAQELVINGGAELPTTTGWTQKTAGDHWAIDAQRPPHSGSYHFYPENTVNATSELYQDIDVSANAARIDAGTASYTFSGWRRGYRNTSPFSNDMDRSQIIVEYLDVSGNVLETYDTGSAVFSVWTNNTDTRNAPIGTRTVRIRLISVRVSSSDNDGYYDDISFIYNAPTCTAPAGITLTPAAATHYCLGSPLSISAVVSPANTNYYYTWYLNGTAIAPASSTYTPFTKPVTTAADAGMYTLRVEDGNNSTAACYQEASVTIILDAAPVAGIISSDQEICLGTAASALTGTASTGGTSVKYYTWQRSNTSASGPWVTVQAYSSTAAGYTPASATGTFYYRRIDSSGACASVPTNAVTIRVNNTLKLDPITSLLRDTLCTGESFQLIPHMAIPVPASLNGGYYFTWKKIQEPATSSTAVAAGSSMTHYPSVAMAAFLSDSGTYILITQDGMSAKKCKDSVQIKIHINKAPDTKALIQSNQEFCLSASATPLTEVRPGSGVSGQLSYQWYTTKDTTGVPALIKIASASSGISYDPGTPVQTNYYVRKDSVSYCPAVKTNFLKVRVNNKPILDSIHPLVNDTLCKNFNEQFQLKGYLDSITAGKASLNGGYVFTWKKVQQTIGTTVLTSAGAYTDYPLTSRAVAEDDSGTYYLIVRDGYGAATCFDSISLHIVVQDNCVAINCSKPDAVSIKVAAGSSDQLCAGTTLILQKDVITFPAVPPTFGYVYSWVRTNTLGTVTVQGPSAMYQDLIVNAVTAADSGRYELVVQDGAASPASLCSERSQPITIVVYDPVTPARIGSDTLICTGSTILPFTELLANSGGTGSYAHQWQSSSDLSAFTDIAGATAITYQPPAISSSIYFRRADRSGNCGVVYSDTVSVITTSGVIPGSITSANGTICYNTIPPQPLLSTGSAAGGTGGNGSELYQWQQSADNINWTDIPGATAINYSETNPLQDTTYYRRRVIMGPGTCDQAYTTSVVLNVSAPFTPGTIGKDTAVCSGSSIRIKELTTATGNNIQYKWIASITKGASWFDAPGVSTAKEYITPGLNDSIWYKRVAISSCSQDSSNLVRVDVAVTPAAYAGTDTTVQKNSIIQLQGRVIGSVNYVWIPSTRLSNANILNPDAMIVSTITYTLKATDVTGTCSAVSIVTITVEDPIGVPNVITPNGDGTNDTWIIERIENYPNAICTIYNRWGNIVWKAGNGAFQWNGTNYRNGEALPDGTYFYIIDLKSTAYPEPYTGYIQLVR